MPQLKCTGLTPECVFLYNDSTCYLKQLGEKKFWVWLNPRFSMPFQSRAWSIARARQGRRRLADDVYQEPNTVASWSTLCCICWRKWKTKLIVPMYFGTKTSRFCFRIISLASLESELSFDSEDSEIYFEWARTTAVNSLLRTLRPFYNISGDEGEEFFRNGKLDTKWRSRRTKSSKNNSRTALNDNFVT